MNDFTNFFENYIMPLVVPLKVSSHFVVVEDMQEALSLTTQREGSIVVLPQLQIGIKCEGVEIGWGCRGS